MSRDAHIESLKDIDIKTLKDIDIKTLKDIDLIDQGLVSITFKTSYYNISKPRYLYL